MEGAYINKKSPERFCDIETAENEVVSARFAETFPMD